MFLTQHVPPIPGAIKARLEDFRVEEVASYEPCGNGDHLFVRFEKRDKTTQQAVQELARACRASARAAGWAGLKDRHGITIQWASFERGDLEALQRADLPEAIRVLDARYHRNKLRVGHLWGNRFDILIRNLPHDRLGDVQRVLHQIETEGLPNFFGEQRFGRDGANADRALRWLAGTERKPRAAFERKFLVSALQALLYNEWLNQRMRDGFFAQPIHGDLMRREDSGGLFIAEDLSEATERFARWEISPTGPIFGTKMPDPAGEAARREIETLRRAGLEVQQFATFGRLALGARRPMRVRPRNLRVQPTEQGARLQFDLPKGSYATVLLDEILKDSSGRPRRMAPLA